MTDPRGATVLLAGAAPAVAGASARCCADRCARTVARGIGDDRVGLVPQRHARIGPDGTAPVVAAPVVAAPEVATLAVASDVTAPLLTHAAPDHAAGAGRLGSTRSPAGRSVRRATVDG